MADAGSVRCEVDGSVAVITLDRPERLNALTGEMLRALGQHYDACDRDDDVRVIVLTGAGRAFSAGADLSGGRTFDRPSNHDTFESSPVRPRAFELHKPVLAAINGHAIGLGLTLTMQCDIRYVASEARLSIPQVRRGVVPDAHSHWTVPRIVGQARAAEILMAGREFTGRQAADWGLCSRALGATEVLAATLELAHDLAEHANPLSMAFSKQMLWRSFESSAGSIDQLEREAHLALMGRPDAIEGATAFLERRAPTWQSRVPRDLPNRAF